MVEDEKRRRAPAMSQEERREAIVRSTLPLLIEHGGAVSTSQIAAAAGIAEGTVFRAFKDKRDLLIACMRTGMNSDDEVSRIERIDPGLPLPDRLTEGLHAVGGYLDRVWTIGQALQAAGVTREDIETQVHGRGEGAAAGSPREGQAEAPGTPGEGQTGRPGAPRESHKSESGAREHQKKESPGPPQEMMRVSRAIARLFEQVTDTLRLEPEHAARLLLGLVFTNRMQGHSMGQAMAEPDELVDLFLHGVIRTTEGNQP